jgi:hypothetical protein
LPTLADKTWPIAECLPRRWVERSGKESVAGIIVGVVTLVFAIACWAYIVTHTGDAGGTGGGGAGGGGYGPPLNPVQAAEPAGAADPARAACWDRPGG